MLYASTSQQIAPPHDIVTSDNPETLRLLLEAALKLPPPPGWDLLNAYQRDILRLTADGLTNAQIGDQLCKSAKSIRNQKTVIIKTLGLTNDWHRLSRYVSLHLPFLLQLRPEPFQK